MIDISILVRGSCRFEVRATIRNRGRASEQEIKSLFLKTFS